MKKSYKKFLLSVNKDKDNQELFEYELDVVKKLKKKGYVKKYNESTLWLTKKGVKKAKSLTKKFPVYIADEAGYELVPPEEK